MLRVTTSTLQTPACCSGRGLLRERDFVLTCGNISCTTYEICVLTYKCNHAHRLSAFVFLRKRYLTCELVVSNRCAARDWWSAVKGSHEPPTGAIVRGPPLARVERATGNRAACLECCPGSRLRQIQPMDTACDLTVVAPGCHNRTSDYASLRNLRGVWPVNLWKTTEKLLWLEYPTWCAISVIDRSVSRNRDLARSTRHWIT